MSWNSFIAQVAEDQANARVFGHSRRITGIGQAAYIRYGKGLRALHNALDKALPDAIDRAKAKKNASHIAELERAGYTVTKNTETQGA
jgi:hypothetical protein